jgi:predicted phosphodiesterase
MAIALLTHRDGAKTAVLLDEIWDLRKTSSNKHSPTSMRIITYSDLHLEFGSGWMLPPDASGDVMILAGDIITLRDYDPLDQLLQKWKKPVLYATGNHEYYTQRPMNEEDERFRAWLKAKHPHVKLLLDEEVSIGGVNFFGGTMWTDFNGGDVRAMETAQDQMNDFRLIRNPDQTRFSPADAVALHTNFASKLLNWLGKDLNGPRVVISHNAPVINLNSKYKGGPLTPAFNSLDMMEIIETHQPALWVYGHTHECDDQTIGRTRIISNQLGYPSNFGVFECKDFDKAGLPVEVGV